MAPFLMESMRNSFKRWISCQITEEQQLNKENFLWNQWEVAKWSKQAEAIWYLAYCSMEPSTYKNIRWTEIFPHLPPDFLDPKNKPALLCHHISIVNNQLGNDTAKTKEALWIGPDELSPDMEVNRHPRISWRQRARSEALSWQRHGRWFQWLPYTDPSSVLSRWLHYCLNCCWASLHISRNTYL